MELTLLEGRKSPHRETGIKQLLVHLDEQLPIDHRVLDWNDFFPSYLMFQMACEWAALGLNFMIPYLRTDGWELDWISDKGPYSSLELQVLKECASSITDDLEKSAAFYIIYSEIDKMGKGAKSLTVLYELLTCVRGINDDYKKSRGLKKIAEELIKQSQEVEAEYVIREALNIVRDISKQSEKSIALMGIAVNLYKLQQREAGSSILKEARDVASFITEISDKANTLLNISEEMHKLGLLEEAAEVIKETIDVTVTHELSDLNLQYIYADIAIELCKQGKVDEALKLARGLKRAENKCFALCEIATQMYKKDSRCAFVLIMDEALLVATEIWNSTGNLSCLETVAENFCRQNCTPKAVALTEGLGSLILTSFEGSSFLSTVALELAKQGELAEATKLALEIVDYSKGAFRKSVALMEIVGHLAQNEGFVTSMQLASKITDKDEYRTALKKIANSLAKSGDLNSVSEFIQLSLSNSPGLNHEEKIGAASEIVFDLTKKSQLKNGLSLLKVIDDEVATELVHLLHENGLFWESRLIAKEIRDVGYRRYCLGIIVDKLSVKQLESIFHELDDEVIIVKLLAKQGEFQQALDIARVMNNVADKDSAFASIALEFRNQEQLNDSLEICKSMVDSWSRTTTMLRIAEELAKKGALKDASDWLKETLSVAWEIKNQGDKRDALIAIAEEMCIQGLVEGALKIIKKLNTVSDGSLPLCTILIELSKQGQLEESLAIARDISNEREKCNTLRKVAIELSKQGKVEESASVMQESLTVAQGISDVWQKNRELMEISIELSKQGKVEESLTIARGISDEREKSRALREISIELSKQGQVEESLTIARGISDDWEKSRALMEISIELSKQGQFEESLTIARGISDDWERDRAMEGISLELSKLSHWDMAVEVGRKISNAAGQQECWEAIGEAMFNLHGGQNALEKLTLLPSEEIRRFYLMGWVGALSVAEASSYCSPLAVGYLQDDMGSLVELLQKYALGQVAFGTPSREWVERLNYSVNIQWLMDLKNQTHE
jgi:tetratricopeptide (TPR) repeat protein